MSKAKILVVGGGGREHALGWKLSKSPDVEKVYYSPGNAGTTENVAIGVKEFDKIKEFCLAEGIEMVVVGPEDPLCAGIHDKFANDERTQHIHVIGPKKAGARLEGSKAFSKEFMKRHNVPTARYGTFSKATAEEGKKFLDELKSGPYVLKADGLAGGKGVLIIDELESAKKSLDEMLSGKFGSASEGVVIEEYLDGEELSVFALIDSSGSYKILPTSCDFKRQADGDKGLNTGGMGAVSPCPFAPEGSEFLEKVTTRIVTPVVKGALAENLGYTGFLYVGLMRVGDDPFVVEFNCRMGDPEAEVVMLRLKSDLYPLLKAVKPGKLGDLELQCEDKKAVGVVLVSGGYPEAYGKGYPISGLDAVDKEEDGLVVFHAGTASGPVTSGGRVLVVSAVGETLKQAREAAYKNASKISFDKVFCRSDIALKLVEKFEG